MANDETMYGEMLTENELDVIGEVMNISMGSAATAVSAMLDKQVTITTPTLTQSKFGEVDYSDMDPSVLVKINYVEGINGTNVIMFRSRDMQIILNLLMGDEDIPPEDSDFEFDEMSMSAACEVMNQMMGSSATALSEVMGSTVNISTPTAHISERGNNVASSLMELDEGEPVVCISFNLMVDDVMDSNFISFLSIKLAREIISIVMPEDADMTPPAPSPAPPAEEAQPEPAAEEAHAPVVEEEQPEPVAAEPPPIMEALPVEPAPEPTPIPEAAAPPEPQPEPAPVQGYAPEAA